MGLQDSRVRFKPLLMSLVRPDYTCSKENPRQTAIKG
jgi:hypothetical protein